MDCLTLLLNHKDIDVNQMMHARFSITPLFTAVVSYRPKCVRLLLTHKDTDVNLMSIYKNSMQTPLHWAAFTGDLESVEYLLDHHSICIDMEKSLGLTPYRYALQSQESKTMITKITEALIKHGAKL